MYDTIIVVGILVSLAYSEITGFSPSGLIVPSYIALNIFNPHRLISTFFVALLTYGILSFMSKRLIIYDKRQFALSVGISVLASIALTYILPINLNVIGNIISGIIANEWKKEGFFISTISLIIVVAIIFGIMMILDYPF